MNFFRISIKNVKNEPIRKELENRMTLSERDVIITDSYFEEVYLFKYKI